jgi:hypothetical protein
MPSRMLALSSATAPKSSKTMAPHEHVSGVRVGVIDAVDEDHLAVQAHQASRHVLLVDSESAKRGDIARLDPLDEGRREHAPSAELAHRLREDDALVRREVACDSLDVVRLEREV